jgi:hypothetical protein
MISTDEAKKSDRIKDAFFVTIGGKQGEARDGIASRKTGKLQASG